MQNKIQNAFVHLMLKTKSNVSVSFGDQICRCSIIMKKICVEMIRMVEKGLSAI